MRVKFYLYFTYGFFGNDEKPFDSHKLAEDYAKSCCLGEYIIIPKIIEE